MIGITALVGLASLTSCVGGKKSVAEPGAPSPRVVERADDTPPPPPPTPTASEPAAGKNLGAKAAPWKGAEAVKLSFVVGGDHAGNLDESNVPLRLDGVAPVIGQTLALHGDKKGQAGKILACGTIDAVGGAP